jgi:putative membrane protein
MPSDLATPRRTSPLAALFWVLRADPLRTLLPAVVVAASSGHLFLIGGAGAILALAFGSVAWWRRTWSFRDGVLQLDEGVLVRNERRIPVERIQHVQLERQLRHQLFDLAAVRIETAGGKGAELQLDFIPRAEAETLRSTILERLRPVTAEVPLEPGAVPPPPPPPPPPETLVKLPPARLLLAGVTGPELLGVFAAVVFALDTVNDLGVDPDRFDDVAVSRAVVAVLGLLAVPFWLAAAAVIGLVRRWDLTAKIVGDELRVTYGLLRRNEFVVKTGRIQDVRIAHRLLLRPFGRADVRVRTAASGSGDRSRVDIPLLAPVEIDHVLQRLLPAAVPLPDLVPAPPAARRRALVRGGVTGVVLAALATLAMWSVGALPALATGAAVVAASVLFGEARYRGLGQAHTGGVVHSRTGPFTRHRTMVADARIQSGSVVATWFQRRRRLASVRLDLAGDAVVVPDRGGDEARALLAGALAERGTAPASGGGRTSDQIADETATPR